MMPKVLVDTKAIEIRLIGRYIEATRKISLWIPVILLFL